MYEPLWRALAPHLSVARMRADIAAFYELSRWSSSDKINALARLIADRMGEAGLEDVRLIDAPADGRTAYGGWVMPRASDVEAARLTVLAPGGVGETLADYGDNPTCLLLYSRATPEEGVTAELAVADGVEDCKPSVVAGRLVLTPGGGVVFGRAAVRAGAVGLVCDGTFGRRFYKEGDYLNETNEWHNYTLPPWDDPGAGFGFAISPAQGRRLRERIAAGETVRLRAEVRTRQYDGTLPVVSGRLRGAGPDEVVLCGHYDEFGADDNCSQVAVALEAVRALGALIAAGQMPPPVRSIRLLFPMEVRGFNALVQHAAEVRHIRLGLNIDTVGTDQNAATSVCTLTDSWAPLPSFAEDLLAELLGRVSAEDPLFRWRRTAADVIDNVFGEPLLGAPTPCLYHYSATHHLPLDTPDTLSGRMLLSMARLSATFTGFVAGAGLDEALWLGELVTDQGVARLHGAAAEALRGRPDAARREVVALHESYGRRLPSARWLAPDPFVLPEPQRVREAERAGAFLGDERLLPGEAYEQRLAVWRARLDRARAEAEALIGERADDPSPADGMPAAPSRCVPAKAFRGYLAFEDLARGGRDAELAPAGLGLDWGAPAWLQEALMWASGKRTAGDIAALLRRHGRATPDVDALEQIFVFLADRGYVRLRPYLTQAAIRAAFEQAGLQPGDAVLGHFALSRFGYVEGGADGLTDTLLDLLGPEGTLMMPAFAFAWVGRPPFYPARSPSRVGAVTDRFWRRPGVARSLHPTHSFAAAGPLAESLLAGHDHTQPPLGEHSPIARLAAAGGKILLFAPRQRNTAMHVGEHLAGLPAVDLVCPVEEGGVRRDAVVPRCPWHVNFEPAYERLYASGLVRDVPLGEGTIHVMRCAAAIEAQEAVARATPELLVEPGCTCHYCKNLREYCAERGR